MRDQPKSGRPRKTTGRIDRIIRRLSIGDRFLTAESIKLLLSRCGQANISRETIARRLRYFGLFGRSAQKKPFVNVKNRKRRIAFARAHLHWTSAHWRKVLFSDESKFNRLRSDGRIYVRRYKGEKYHPKCILHTMRGGGGSVMVWGAFSASGVGPIRRIEVTQKSVDYCKIIQDTVKPHMDEQMPKHSIFQHDNAPIHTAKIVTDLLQLLNIQVLDFPPQSPDLNPIENLWLRVKLEVDGEKPENVEQLWDGIQRSWYKLQRKVLTELADAMPGRCKAVIKNFGYPTRY